MGARKRVLRSNNGTNCGGASLPRKEEQHGLRQLRGRIPTAERGTARIETGLVQMGADTSASTPTSGCADSDDWAPMPSFRFDDFITDSSPAIDANRWSVVGLLFSLPLVVCLWLIIGVEVLLYVLVRMGVLLWEWARLLLRPSQRRLQSALRVACTHDEWSQLAKSLDALLENSSTLHGRLDRSVLHATQALPLPRTPPRPRLVVGFCAA